MEILIKSFNRPYYLDRCLGSIYKNCVGVSSIKVLDDGTPQQYLEKIQEKYPEVIILRSNQFSEKNKAIAENLENGREINGFKIPVQFWKTAVKETSPYFVMTEDDVWFTEKVNFQDLQKCMEQNNISLIKLGDLGKKHVGLIENCNHSKILYPKLNVFTAPKNLFKPLFFNKFKLFSLAYRLKLVDNNFHYQYYNLFSILMGLYKKEYWLELWEGIDEQVNESQQMFNAAMYYHRHKSNKKLIGIVQPEVMKTTFKSSATNSYHKYNTGLDVNRFNHIMNEYWYRDELNTQENYPKDFSDDYLKNILEIEQHPKASTKAWAAWAEIFKNQYRALGCELE